MNEVWIVGAARSPRAIGKPGKSRLGLGGVHPQQCLAQVLNGLQAKVGFDPADVDDVIMGCANATEEQGMDIARMSALAAGWPTSVAGVTLNRFCGSGQQAVNFAAMGIMSGQQDLVVAGGVEYMSLVPSAALNFFHAGNDSLLEMYPMVPQGISADLIASLNNFSRDDCDALAVESQKRAAAAIDKGYFDDALVKIVDESGRVVLDRDELVRPGTSMQALASLSPSFAEMAAFTLPNAEKTFRQMALEAYPQVNSLSHVHHAGNSSGVSDGASAIALCSPEYARANGLKPLGRLKMTAVAANDPVIMLTAPGPAAKKCLARAGMSVADIDLWEVNEAFASVVLKFNQDLDIDPAAVNIYGGAIALGHPIGATGGMLIQTALEALEREDKSAALVAMCTGGGMGTATIVERI